MKISSNNLINLPVYTQAGDHLGQVDSFEINIDTRQIENYHVKTGSIKGLWHEQLVINHSQVVSISDEKMVVEDSTKKQPAAGSGLGGVKLASPATE